MIARTGSDRPTIDSIDGSVVDFACMASWLRAPSSILMANSCAFSGSSVTFKSSFCISGSFMLAVKMSLNNPSSPSPLFVLDYSLFVLPLVPGDI